MAKLTAAARKKIPKSNFAVPSKAPKSGSYPIEDRGHPPGPRCRVPPATPACGQGAGGIHRKYPPMKISALRRAQ